MNAARIYSAEKYTDEKGECWIAINGDTHYSLTSGWTEESAKADYISPEATLARWDAEYRAWCD